MVKKADFTPEKLKNILTDLQASSKHVSLSGTSGIIRVKKR